MPYNYLMKDIITTLCLALFIYTSLTQADRAAVIQDQLNQLLSKIRNSNVAILTNPTSVDGRMLPLFDRIIAKAQQYNATIKCFFAPEHGLRGNQQAGAGDEDYVDPQTGIQVYSLYGVRKAPTDAQLKGVDMLIYDIQDVGARYYTYIWTLTYTIESCAKNNVEVVIFDRPNPIGRKIEGCPLRIDAGFVGRLLPGQAFSLPQRYGLTVGELILFLRIYLPFFKLTVIKMSKWYQIKDNEWVMSSPNIPTIDTTYVYAGMGLFQGTTASEGRGTTKPFQLTGNIHVNASEIRNYFKSNSQATGYGKSFYIRDAYFIPTFSKNYNQICGGAEIHITDRQRFQSVRTALHMIKAYLLASREGEMKISSGIDRLFGVLGFSSSIQTKDVDSILRDCSSDRQLYEQISRKIWLYEEGGAMREEATF